MRRIFAACFGALLVVCGVSAAQAKLNVFACEPEWAALTTAIGGGRVDVKLAITALTDPEKTGANPGMIVAMQQADLFVCTGANLETSWLPAVLEKANNPKVAPGKPGQFYASQFVQIQTDTSPIVDTLHQHLHNEGNPHIQGDPRNMIRVGAQLTKRLIALDPDGGETYAANFKAFAGKLKDLIAALEKKAAPLRNQRVIVQHEHSLYLLNWLGLGVAATVEPEPGVPPGPDHLSKVVKMAVANGAKFVIGAAYEDLANSKYVAEKAGIAIVKVPFTVGGTPEAKDLFSFYDDSVNRLLDGLAGTNRT